MMRNLPLARGDVSGLTDEKVFIRFSYKGRETEGPDFDYEKVYEEQNEANSSYHNKDEPYVEYIYDLYETGNLEALGQIFLKDPGILISNIGRVGTHWK